MNPGDLATVYFPFSSSEPQPFKKRPVLVLTATGTPPDQAIFCAMVTSNARRFAHPAAGDVAISEWQSAGLLAPSVVRTRRIWTAEQRDFTGKVLGQVNPATLDVVRQEIRDLLT